MGEIGAVEQLYPCFDELVGVVGDTRAMGLRVQRADNPHARSSRTSDQVVRKWITRDVRPLVDACLQRKRGSLGPTEMGGDDEPVRMGFVDDRPEHFKRGDRPWWRVGGLMPAGPRCAWRPTRLQSDLDERRTAGDELADGSAGRLDVGYFISNVVVAEYRDRIATGCGEDRPGAEHAQASIAARGPHERAARVPHRREAVTQNCFLWGLVKQQMGV